MNPFRLLFALPVILLLLLSSGRPAQAQRFEWLQGQVHASQIRNSFTNAAGYTLVATTYTDSLVTSQGSIPGVGWFQFAGQGDVKGAALLLYNPDGKLVQTTLLNDHPWEITACALDAANNAYVSANQLDTVSVIGGVVQLVKRTMLLKYDASGQKLWARKLTGEFTPWRLSEAGVVYSMDVDAAGDCYYAGQAYNQDSVGGVAVDTAGTVLNFIGKCSAAGQFQWLQQIRNPLCNLSTNANTGAYTVHVSPAGECALTGECGDVTTFGTGPTATIITTPLGSNRNAFVARYSTTGALQWVRSAAGSYLSPYFSAAVPAGAATYLTGLSANPFTFGGQRRTAGIFLALLNAAGQPTWVQQPSDTTGGFILNIVNDLTLDSQGKVYVLGEVIRPCTWGSVAIETGPFIAQFDAQGAAQWSVPIPKAPGLYLGVMKLETDAADNLYFMGYLGSHVAMPVGPFTAHGNGSFILKINSHVNRLTGTVYLDANANNQRDAGEDAFPSPMGVMEMRQQQVATTAPDGRFTAYADQGAYDLRLPQVPRHYQLSQGNAGHQGSFAGYGRTDTARHFGLAPIPGQLDVRVSLTPYSPARRGIPTRYRARVENLGTTVASGLVTVDLDPAVAFVGAVPTAQVQAHQLRWSFSGLAPFASRDFDLTVNVPLNVTVGTTLTFMAEGVPSPGVDVTPADNVDTVQMVVVGSFDPNDLSVNYATLTAAQIAAGEPLDYVVNFQNMGTDTAFSVVIQDSLPAGLLQLGTVELISQSHNVQWMLSGPGLLTLRFPGIKLPHQAVDAVRSQGFVRFRLVPRTTLTAGTLIPNRAHIVFDFNPPVPTNQATTLVQSVAGLPHEPGATALSVYPNPATDQVTIGVSLPVTTTVSVRLLNALGREVRAQQVPAPAGLLQVPLEVRGLAPGVYLVTLTVPDGTRTTRRLVIH